MRLNVKIMRWEVVIFKFKLWYKNNWEIESWNTGKVGYERKNVLTCSYSYEILNHNNEFKCQNYEIRSHNYD